MREIIHECAPAYLAAFVLAYTGGLVFGIYAVLRVMAQYKRVTLMRQDQRFLLRNRMMMAVAQRIGAKHAVSQALHSEKGHILGFHAVQMCVLFAALQISTS